MVGVRVCEIARGIRFQECFHGQSFFCRALGGQQRRSIYRSAGRCSNAPQEVDGRFRTSQILKKIRTADEFAPTKVFVGACKLEFNFPAVAHESLAGRVLLQALKAPSLCRQQLHQELRRGRPRKRRSILAVAVRVVAHWPEERQEQLAAAAELTAPTRRLLVAVSAFAVAARSAFGALAPIARGRLEVVPGFVGAGVRVLLCWSFCSPVGLLLPAPMPR